MRARLATTLVLVLTLVARIPVASAADPTHRDVQYARIGDRSLLLDIYLPTQTGPGNTPLVIWIHGGAWRSGTKAKVPVTHWLKEGFAIASVEYRLSREARFPAQVHDIKAAIRFLRKSAGKYGFDPQRFIIAGASAGGHLAALVGVTNNHTELEGTIGDSTGSSDVQAVVSFYGASNLESILSQSTEHGLSVRVPALRLLLGDLPDKKVALARLASPTRHVDPTDPPLLLIHGDADPQMPPEQSDELHAAYQHHHRPSNLSVIQGAKHGGAEFYTPARLSDLAELLKQALKP